MMYDMKECGLLKFSKRVDSLSVQVLFLYPDSPVVLHISDFRNLGNQYHMYYGESYLQCAQCGLTIKRKNNTHKYCLNCAAEMYIKKSVESVMRHKSPPSTKQNTLHITYLGETKGLAEWADQLNIPYQRLYGRIYRCGWSVEKAFER